MYTRVPNNLFGIIVVAFIRVNREGKRAEDGLYPREHKLCYQCATLSDRIMTHRRDLV